MSIARLDGRMQLCCDACPASFRQTFPAADFMPMIAAARADGWRIEKRLPKAKDTSDLFGSRPRVAGPKDDPFAHICPACARRPDPQRALI